LLATGQRLLFGDRHGRALFVGALLVYLLTWRIGFIINDSYTIANTFVAVVDGHLHVDQILYGPRSGATPGMHVRDGRLYGRHYGLVFFGLPFLWAVEAVALVAAPRLVVAGLWSLGFAGVVRYLRRYVDADRRRWLTLAGYAGALVFFVANVWVHTPVEERWYPQMALQLSTMVAGGLLVVLLYRLVARMYTSQLGLFAGVVAVLASPVTFWATIPKRHTLTALFVFVTLYSFYRSRASDDERSTARFRALSYVSVGLLAWISPPEGAILFVALVPVDLATASSNSPRRLALVGSAFALSLLPFLLTNLVVTGNPIEPPLVLPGYEGGSVGGSSAGGAGAGGPETNTGDSGGIVALVAIAVELAGRFSGRVTRGVSALVDPGHLYDVFVRSGYDVPGFHRYGPYPVNVSVLEAMPVASLLLLTPVLGAKRLRERGVPSSLRLRSPRRATDLLALVYIAVVCLIYVPLLPGHVQFTMRYLHVLYPLFGYFLVRLRLTRRIVTGGLRLVTRSYAVGVFAGGLLVAAIVAFLMQDPGASVQLHARLGLATAAALTYAGGIVYVFDAYERLAAVALGIAGSSATIYLAFAAFEYINFNSRGGLPVVRFLLESSLIG
jgi:hypothetical protein